MKSVYSSQSTRKAHSATKIHDIQDLKNKSKISCASATYYSSREKIRNTNNQRKLHLDETQNNVEQTDNTKRKLFLNASQVLSKLQRISASCQDSRGSLTVSAQDQIHSTKKLKLSFKKLNFYCDMLKKLLEERCIMLLKDESRHCIRQTQKLISVLKHFFSNEVIKLTTMPIKSYNRFIDSSDISLSVLEQLFMKVNSICDLHSSLKNNYQNIINFFHVGFDMDLNHMLITLNKFLKNLYSEVFYWTNKVLEIFILRLCLADPDSVSPEFLHNVLEICESFNLLFFDKMKNYTHITNKFGNLLNSYMHSDYDAVLLKFILHYLSHFEAKVAAEKIINYLIHECKNCIYLDYSEYSTEHEKKEKNSSNTSDYYSVSPSVVEENGHSLSNDIFNFENVFLSFIQRNQSQILKYLYSIVCLDISMPVKGKNISFENISDSSTVNNAWNLPQSACKSKSYLCLEEKYWVCFWEKVFTFCLKLVLEVPCHQYGNAAAGMFLLWPHSYHNIMLKLLKSSAENKDISSHASNVLKKLFHYLLSLTTEAYWDKNMSLTLPLMHNQHCMPILVTESKARTQTGNALCSCLESLGISFLNTISTARHPFYQVLCSFQVTFDCFIHFTDIRTRSSVSSVDLNTFLLISFSDCVHALKLLKERSFTGIFNQFGHFKCIFSSNSLKACISSQIEALSGHISDAPFIIHRIIFDAVRSTYKSKIKMKSSCILNHDILCEMERCSFSSIDEVLSSFVDILPHIYDEMDLLFLIVSATASSLLSVLQLIRKNKSHKEIQAIKEILYIFFKWLETLEIEEYHRERLKSVKCLQKIPCIIHVLEISPSPLFKNRYFQGTGNKVSPLLTGISLNERMVLTEEEELYWRTSCQRNYPCI